MLTVLAYDPGLAKAAAATVRLAVLEPAGPHDFEHLHAAAKALDRAGVNSCKTNPGFPEPARLARLYSWAYLETVRVEPDVVTIEKPPAWHNKRQRGRQRASASMLENMAGVNRAVGAIVAGVYSALEELDAEDPAARIVYRLSKMPKENRRDRVNLILASNGVDPIRNKDEADAAYYAIRLVSEIASDGGLNLDRLGSRNE